MANKMINGQDIFDWVNEKYNQINASPINKDDAVYICGFLYGLDQVSEKIQEVMSEIQPESGKLCLSVNPERESVPESEWQVGDRLISKTDDWLVAMKNAYFKGFGETRTVSNLILIEVNDDNEIPKIEPSMVEYWHNIDAELRALQDEIKRLKNNDPWRTDLENAPRSYFDLK